MTRRSKGIIFLLVGCIFLLVACAWYAYNIAEDKNAGKMASEILGKMQYVHNNAPIEEQEIAPVIVVEGDAFCGKVIVEALGIELPVYNEWDYERLKNAPCRYSGSIATQDMVIAAHDYKSHFGALGKIKNGNEVLFVDAYGAVHCYTVQEITTLDGTAVSDMQSGDWDLTLFTCTIGGEHRITVRCEKKAS